MFPTWYEARKSRGLELTIWRARHGQVAGQQDSVLAPARCIQEDRNLVWGSKKKKRQKLALCWLVMVILACLQVVRTRLATQFTCQI